MTDEKVTFSYLDLSNNDNHSIVVRKDVPRNVEELYARQLEFGKVIFNGTSNRLIKIIELGILSLEIMERVATKQQG